MTKEYPERGVRLCIGNHTADLLPDKTGNYWFFVVQPVNCREIVAIDRCDTYEQARNAAYKVLERLNGTPNVVPNA